MKDNWRNFIAMDSAAYPGKASVRGKNIPVEAVLDELGRSGSIKGVRSRFPQLSAVEIRACLSYASELVQETILPPSSYVESKFLRYFVS